MHSAHTRIQNIHTRHPASNLLFFVFFFLAQPMCWSQWLSLTLTHRAQLVINSFILGSSIDRHLFSFCLIQHNYRCETVTYFICISNAIWRKCNFETVADNIIQLHTHTHTVFVIICHHKRATPIKAESNWIELNSNSVCRLCWSGHKQARWS